jgi:hypothetical protein
MNIKFNPRISKSFASVVLKTDRVKEVLHDIDSEQERLEIVHQILIEGFTRYNININELINHLKEEI